VAWYQAKNVRSVIYEVTAAQSTKAEDARHYALEAKRMRTDMEQIKYTAEALESEQKALSAKSPYYTYSAMLMQLGLVLSTAAILAVSMPLFFSAVAVGSFGAVLFAIALIGV
jgi:saccharopine dehydrogenase-like NADP-dependent oxidoreductase